MYKRQHIVYVNGQFRDLNHPVGRLMHDMNCTNAADILNPLLAQEVRYLKMCIRDSLKTLRKIGSYLQGHPNMNETPGVDMSTGSLGQGCLLYTSRCV